MLEDAIQLHRAGRLDEAETAYRQLLAETPDSAEVLHLLGIVRGQRGDLPEAYQLVRRAIELAPLRPTPHYTLGEMYLSELRLDEARAAYDEARQLDPNLAGAHAGLGQVAFLKGDVDAAENHFKVALRADENDVQALTGLGNVAQARGDSVRALQLLTQAAEGAPDEPFIQASYARAMLDQGMLDFAGKALDNALAVRPGYAVAQVLRADVHVQKGEFAAAAPIYESLLARGEQAPAVRTGLGDIARAQGRYADAIVQYDEALRLLPALDPAAIRRADALARSGRVAQAIGDLRARVAASADNVRIYIGLAGLLTQVGRHDEALAVWADAEARWPEDLNVRAQHALALDSAGRTDAALALAERAAAAPQPALALLRARGALLAGDAEAALARLEKITPDRADVTPELRARGDRLRGLAYDHLQRWPEAVAAFTAAQRSDGQPLPTLPAIDTAQADALRDLAATATTANAGAVADGAPVFLCGLPGSGVGKVAGVLADLPGWVARGRRFPSVTAYTAALDPARPGDAPLAELASISNKYGRARRRAGVADGVNVADRIPVLDARVVPLLARAFPGAKLVVVRRALDDALLNWLGFGWAPSFHFEGATEAAHWLARANVHLALASELMPSCVVDADDFLAATDAPAREALAAFLGVDGLFDGAHAIARKRGRGGLPVAFPVGHAAHYREALADAFAALAGD